MGCGLLEIYEEAGEKAYRTPPENLGFLNVCILVMVLFDFLTSFSSHLSVCLMQGGRVITWREKLRWIKMSASPSGLDGGKRGES